MKKILILFFTFCCFLAFGQTLLSPSEKLPPKTNRPTFEWKSNKVFDGITYSLMLRELEEGKDLNGGKLVFEVKDIKTQKFLFPPELPALDTSKVYSWVVSSYDKKMQLIEQSTPIEFYWGLPKWCFLFQLPKTIFACVGDPIQFNFILIGGSGSLNWTLSNNQSGHLSPINLSPLPTIPGVYTYILTVTKGSCIRTAVFTVHLYDPVTPGGPTVVNPPSICDGDDATIEAIPGPTNGVNINWEYKDNIQLTWMSCSSLPSTPLGILGNPAGTNQQFAINCNASPWFTTRQFRAHVGSTDPSAPLCASTYTSIGTLKIYCKPSINISVSPSAPICNTGTPVTFTLSANNVIGNVSWTSIPSSFTISGSGPIWTATGIPPISGDITFTAIATTGGPCPFASKNVTIKVDQPVTCPSGITTNRDLTSPPRTVCPPQDAELYIKNCQNVGVVEWAYSKTSGLGPWTNFGGNGIWQNTNNGTLGIYVHTWYKAIVHTVLDVCPPLVLYTDVNVFPGPTPPIVAPSGPITVCEGATTPLLNVTPPAGSFTYTWMHNGNPAVPPTTWAETDAGYWWVTSKDNCGRTAISNIVNIKVEVITIEVGPCCGTNPPTLFVVSATSSIYGNFIPSSGNIEWRDGSCTGQIVSTGLSIPVPIAGQSYCVRVRNSSSSCWSVCRCFVTPIKCK